MDQDRKRQTIRLGKVTKRVADKHKEIVEAILSARSCGLALDAGTSSFVSRLTDALRKRYVATGLLSCDENACRLGVKDYMDSFFQSVASTLKPSTLTCYGHTRSRIEEYFGDRKLGEITPFEARSFQTWLEKESNKRD